MAFSLNNARMRGLSLLETLTALAVVSAMLLAIFGGYVLTAESQKVQTAVEQISKLGTVVHTQLSSRQYSGLDTTMARSYGAFKGQDTDGDGYPYSPWRARIVVTGNTDTYDVTYEGVSRRSCVQFVLALVNEQTLSSVRVDGGTIRYTHFDDDTGHSNEVTTQNLISDCTRDPADITWRFH